MHEPCLHSERQINGITTTILVRMALLLWSALPTIASAVPLNYRNAPILSDISEDRFLNRYPEYTSVPAAVAAETLQPTSPHREIPDSAPASAPLTASSGLTSEDWRSVTGVASGLISFDTGATYQSTAASKTIISDPLSEPGTNVSPSQTFTDQRELESDRCIYYLETADLDGDGSLTRKEFALLMKLLGNTQVAVGFSELPREAQELFESLAKGNNKIDLSEMAKKRELNNNIFWRDRKPKIQAGLTLDTLCDKASSVLHTGMAASTLADSSSDDIVATIDPSQPFSEAATIYPTHASSDASTALDTEKFETESPTDSDNNVASDFNSMYASDKEPEKEGASLLELREESAPAVETLFQESNFTGGNNSSETTTNPGTSSGQNQTVTPPPTPQPAPSGTRILAAYNSWYMSNTLGLTAMDLQSSRTFNGLNNAYEAFVTAIVAEMTTSRSALRVRRLRQRGLAVSLAAEPTSVYAVIGDECPSSAAEGAICTRVFGQVDLLVDGYEVTDAVFNEYIDLSQTRIDDGLLQEKVDQESPGSVWIVQESALPLRPSDLEPGEEDNEKSGERLGLGGGLILSAAVSIAVLIIVCLFVVLPEQRKQKRIADARKKSLMDLREAEAVDEVVSADKQKKRNPISEPKKKHNEKTNPYRIRIARTLDQYCPDRKKDLDSLLHQFKGREEELIAILKDTKSEESVLNDDSSEDAEIWESESESESESSGSVQEQSSVSAEEHLPASTVDVPNDESQWESEPEEIEGPILAKSASSLEPPGKEGRTLDQLEPPGVSANLVMEDEESFVTEDDEEGEKELLEREAERLAAEEEERLVREEAERAAAAAERERIALEAEKLTAAERAAAEKAVAEEMERLRRILAEEEEARKKAELAVKLAEEAREKAEHEAKLAEQARLKAETARKVPEPDSKPKAASRTIATDEDTAHETMESDWIDSEEGTIATHWYRENGYWKARKIRLVEDDDRTEDECYSDDETLSTAFGNRWRWVKDGASWVKELISEEGSVSGDSSFYDSDSNEEDGHRWVQRNGKWIQEPVDEVGDAESLCYSTDDASWVAERSNSFVGSALVGV